MRLPQRGVLALAVTPFLLGAELDDDTRCTVVTELQKILKSFDRDGDSRLASRERQALERHVVDRHGQKWLAPVRAVLDGADADGNGVITEAEWAAYSRPASERAPARSKVTTVMVPMADGIRLATDVHLPGRGEGPWPALLTRTPYGRARDGSTPDGIVTVIQDSRGRFDSEGWNSPFGGCGWIGPTDGADTIAWIRKQPWCDGRVFTMGGSACGITQLLTAPARCEGLVAQYIVVATPDLYRHAAYVGGAFRKSQVENWVRDNHFDEKALPCFKAHYEYDAFWERYDAQHMAGNVTVPAVHVGGWFDTFALGTVEAFRSRQDEGGIGARGRQKLVMGPWTHGVGRKVAIAGHHFPDHGIPRAYTLESWGKRWILKKGAIAPEPPAVAYYVMGDVRDPEAPGNEWRYSDDWPIANQATAFYVHADGTLSRRAPAPDAPGPAFLQYTFDPQDPCPTRGGCNLCIEAGPLKQNDVEVRSDVLSFTTTPLAEPLEVTGHAEIRMFLSSSAVDTDLSVRLCDVYPDGSSYLMAEGMQRVRYRMSVREASLMTPGQVYEIAFSVWPTSIVFNRGHRIRVSVTSSNYPRFDRNPGTGKPWDDQGPVVTQVNRIHVNAERPSRILLPVVVKGTNGDSR